MGKGLSSPGQPGSGCPGETRVSTPVPGSVPLPPHVPAWFEFSRLSESGIPDAPEDVGHKQVNINSTSLALNANLFGLAVWGTARL